MNTPANTCAHVDAVHRYIASIVYDTIRYLSGDTRPTKQLSAKTLASNMLFLAEMLARGKHVDNAWKPLLEVLDDAEKLLIVADMIIERDGRAVNILYEVYENYVKKTYSLR